MVFKYADEIKGKCKNRGLLLVRFFPDFSLCSWRISLMLKRVKNQLKNLSFQCSPGRTN